MKKTNSKREAPNNQEDKLGDNIGRWNKQQHELFLIGYNQYGKNWKNIAMLVKTRTSSQVRSHAQKYFYKIEKDNTKNDQLIINEPRKLRTRNRNTIHRTNHTADQPTPALYNNLYRYPNVIITEQPQAEEEEQERPSIVNIPNIPGQVLLPLSFFMQYVYPPIVTRGRSIQSLIQMQSNKQPQQIKQYLNTNKSNRLGFKPYNR